MINMAQFDLYKAASHRDPESEGMLNYGLALLRGSGGVKARLR